MTDLGRVIRPTAPDSAISFGGPRRPTDSVSWRMVMVVIAGLALIFGGAISILAAKRSAPAASVQSTVAASATARPDDSTETTNALRATQQETVDQLQEVQDQLAAQKRETEKLTNEVAVLSEKLNALQKAVGNLPAASSTRGH